MRGYQKKKQKRLHETQTECHMTATDIWHTRLHRTITWGDCGLLNQSVICYSKDSLQWTQMYISCIFLC